MTATQTPPNPQILVADDDDSFRQALVTWLERHGFSCVSAPDAATALQELRGDTFDALLADIHMPGNHALELVREASVLAEGMPIVLLTGSPSVTTAAQAVELPVVSYVSKPPDLEALGALLHRSIRGYRRVQSILKVCAQQQGNSGALEKGMGKGRILGQDPQAAEQLLPVLRGILVQLARLERGPGFQTEGPPLGSHREAELLVALRGTIAVLEQTKQNFKSKQLASLRRDLEQLLARADSRTQPRHD